MSKICTTIEQSQKLIEFGINANTADMWYDKGLGVHPNNIPQVRIFNDDVIDCYYIYPAWSLTALLDVLNKEAYFIDEDASVNLSSYKTIEWTLGIDNSDLEFITNTDPIDACYEMILKLHEHNLL